MLEKHKKHSLEDDILWQLGNLSMKSGRHEEAVKYFERILNEFSTDVHGDNANFTLGVIYEEYLKNKEKAMFYFQEQLVKFPGSIFNVEARKRFRALRGDSNTLN
jgi:outer membrane protein assembly factor BamD (BamD/ComL family)